MKKNDDVICDLWVTDSHGHTILSCSTVAHLDIGDKVKVTGNNVDSATVYGSFRGFSGILIYAD